MKLPHTFNNPLLVKPFRDIPKSIAVIGSGTIGPDIGYFLKNALPNIILYLIDIKKEALFSAERRIDNYIKKAIQYRKIDLDVSKNIKENIIYTTNYEEISECDLVIEAATENIILKQNIFSKIEKIVSKETIITSNTSSIPANRIFSKMLNCKRTAVTHFFAPAWKSLPVEIVGWDKTDQKVIDFLCWFFATTGKVPIKTKDVVCFMLDRIFDNWCNEAAYLLSDVSADQIDKIAEEFVYAGPFFVLNMAKGNRIIFETNTLQMEEGEHYKPSNIFNSVESWLTCGSGSELQIPKDIKSKIRDRLLGILFSQTVDILDNKIGNASDLNLGCELALGFRKGPLELMDIFGKVEVDRLAEAFGKERLGFPKRQHSFDYYQDFKRFILEDDIKAVKIITIRRPQSMNALNDTVTDEILNSLKQYSEDQSINGFVIVGFGNVAFSSGADIGKFTEMLGHYESSVQYARNCAKVQRFIDKMEKPVVAAVNGLALGAGLEIAIRCHGIVADKNAIFQFPEVSLGILPGIGGCIVPYRKWPQGANIFNKMIMLSEKLSVEKANKIGMLNGIANGYDALIMQAIDTVYSLKGRVRPLDEDKHCGCAMNFKIPDKKLLLKSNLSFETVSIIVETIKAGVLEKKLSVALEIGYKGFGKVACTISAKEGISAFIGKRKPVFNN